MFEIRRQVGTTALITKIERSQLRWLGYLERMSDERTAKKRWVWRPIGSRSVGRPRKGWMDTVEDVLKNNGLPNIEQLRADDGFNQ